VAADGYNINIGFAEGIGKETAAPKIERHETGKRCVVKNRSLGPKKTIFLPYPPAFV